MARFWWRSAWEFVKRRSRGETPLPLWVGGVLVGLSVDFVGGGGFTEGVTEMSFWKRTEPWRVLFLLWGLGFWLAGYFFFSDGWWHLEAFHWVVTLPFFLILPSWWGAWVLAMRENRVLQFFILGVLFYSLRTGEWLEGGLMLIFLNALALIGRERWKQTGNWLVGIFLVGAVTMGWSLWEFYGAEQRGVLELRFKNLLVYEDGLNPVLTGMLCGLALLCGLSVKIRGGSFLLRFGLSVLMFGVLASRSRGALLALIAGLVVWLFWKGRNWREARGEWSAILVGWVAYAVAVYFSPPVAEGMGMMERGSSGRLDIYQTYLGQLSGMDWVWGRGPLVMLEEEVLGWLVHTPHSVFLCQLWQTGLIGLSLLLGGLGLAACRGLHLWGESKLARAWLMWLGFGVMALLFDGGQVFVLNSLPRLEPFLLLVPAVMLGARVELRIQNPESRIQNPESRIQNF